MEKELQLFCIKSQGVHGSQMFAVTAHDKGEALNFVELQTGLPRDILKHVNLKDIVTDQYNCVAELCTC